MSPAPAPAGRSPRRRSPRVAGRTEAGTVTAELAIVLPAVVLVLLVCCVVGAATLGQIRCADAARAGARAAALGESHAIVVATARQLAGDAAEVNVAYEGEWVRVEVSSSVAGDLVGLRGLRASATARALVEPGGPGG